MKQAVQVLLMTATASTSAPWFYGGMATLLLSL